jgi:hypothetical protein
MNLGLNPVIFFPPTLWEEEILEEVGEIKP